MENLKILLQDIFTSQNLVEGILSSLRQKDSNDFTKVIVRPVLLKNDLHYQFTYHYPKKVVHENLLPSEAEEKCTELFMLYFKQGTLQTTDMNYQILISKKEKVTILKKKAENNKIQLSHNRKKQYLLEEGTPVPFLVELGVMNQEGRVLAKKYDKFKQINRFLEMIEDVTPALSKDSTLNIIDFGCGKSYLTFALYHYLKEVKGFEINVIGLDLKEDVICHCNALSEKLNFKNLHFRIGDISQYDEVQQVDMVVTLHACDTATDAALEKAVRWGAKVILSVPCCQHELFNQVHSETLTPMLHHGIIKERFSALATDSMRAALLDILGYKAQILEFIDMEHTPKNLLIRAIKQTGTQDLSRQIRSYLSLKEFLHVEPYLEKILQDQLTPLFEKQV